MRERVLREREYLKKSQREKSNSAKELKEDNNIND